MVAKRLHCRATLSLLLLSLSSSSLSSSSSSLSLTHSEQKTKARHLAVSASGQFYAQSPAPFSCHVNQTQALGVRCREQRETSRPTVCETARCLCALRTSGFVCVCVCMCVCVCVCVCCVRINRRSLSKCAQRGGRGTWQEPFQSKL